MIGIEPLPNVQFAQKKRDALSILQVLLFGGLGILLIAAPLMRGLYYYLELAQAQVWLGALFVLYAVRRFLEREKQPGFGHLEIFLFVYLAAYLLSLFTAVHIKDAFIGAFKAFDYVLIFFLVRELTRELQWRNRLVTIIFAGSVLLTAVSFLASLELLQLAETAYGPGTGLLTPLEYENAYAILAAAGVILGLGLVEHYPAFWAKTLTGLGVCLNAIGVLVSFSRGTWVLLGLILVIYLLANGGKNFWKSFYFLALIIFTASMASKGYLDAVKEAELVSTRNWLLGGLALSGLGTFLIYRIPNLMSHYRIKRHYSLVLPWVLALGLVVVGAVYFTHTVNVIPTGSGQIISGDVAGQTATIGGQDNSYQMRIEMSKMAWRMMLERPFTGAGGGGWNALHRQYQEYFYWANETHNQYLQVGVETGFPGFLAYLGFWLGLLVLTVRYFLKRRGSSSWPLTLSVSLAVLAILLHSALDFELSMAACALILWSLGAMLSAQVVKKSHSKKTIKIQLRGAAAILGVIIFIFGAFSVGAGLREREAQAAVRQGAQALVAGRYEEALGCYEQAARLSPYTGETAANLAQLHAYMYARSKDEDHKTKAYANAHKAVTLTPGYIPGSQKAAQAYLFLGDNEARILEQERLAVIAPKMVEAWSALAISYRDKALALLDRGEATAARAELEKCVAIIETVEENYILAKKQWIMRPNARLYLAAGQAAWLLGGKDNAEARLLQAVRHEETKDAAGTWLASLYKNSDEKKYASYFKTYVQNNPENQAVMKKLSGWFATLD